jgi:hypothetical protein
MALSDYQQKLRIEQLQAIENLTDAQQTELESLQALGRERERELDRVADLSKLLQKNLKLTDEQTEAIKGTVNAFAPLNERMSSFYTTMNQLKNPLTAGFELIRLSAERFVALDNAAAKFRETTGFLASQTGTVETNIKTASRDLSEFGVTADIASESAQQLAIAFGDTAIANKENIEYVSLMKQNLGISAEDSTALMQNFMGIGGMSSKVARETAGAAASMAKAAGVPFGAVMKEVSKPSTEVRALIRGSVDALIKGAIEAKRLGTSLEAVGRAAAGMLDFQTSVNDEMEASVLFGRDVNLQKARELAYAGDLENLAKEQSRLLKEAGDVSKMDYFQRIGIAKALGMSVEEMDKMNAKQQELNRLRIEDPETYEKLTAKQKVMDKTKESLSEKYKKELLSQQLASQQEKIMQSIQSIMTEMAEAFLPVINTLLPVVAILFKISVIITKFILAPFRLLTDVIDEGLKALKPYVDVVKLIEDGLNKISSFFSTPPEGVSDWGFKIGAAVAAAVVLGFSVTGSNTLVGTILKLITSPFTLASKLIPNYIKGTLNVAKNAVSGAVSSITGTAASAAGATVAPAAGVGDMSKTLETTSKTGENVKPTAGQNIKQFLTNLAEGIKSFKPLGEILKGLLGIAASGPAFLLFIPAIPGLLLMAGVGALGALITAGFTALSTGIKMMDISVIGKGLLGIAGLGLSIIPFAFAMSLFSDVNWTGVIAGAAALVVFAAAAFGLGALLTGPGAIIFGAGVLGIAALGAAMIPLGYAAKLAGEGMKDFGTGVKDIASSISQIASLESTLSVFKDGEIIDGIYAMGIAVGFLNSQLAGLGNNLPILGELNNAINNNSGNAEVVAKLDELIGLMKSGAIAVNIDGTKATTLLGISTKFRGANGVA